MTEKNHVLTCPYLRLTGKKSPAPGSDSVCRLKLENWLWLHLLFSTCLNRTRLWVGATSLSPPGIKITEYTTFPSRTNNSPEGDGSQRHNGGNLAAGQKEEPPGMWAPADTRWRLKNALLSYIVLKPCLMSHLAFHYNPHPQFLTSCMPQTLPWTAGGCRQT